MEKIAQPAEAKKKRWLHRKPIHFEVRIVPPEDYPDLAKNPTNPFAQMSDEERQEEFTDMLGLVWAETCLEESKKAGASANHDTGILGCNGIKNRYDITHPKYPGGDHGQKVPKME